MSEKNGSALLQALRDEDVEPVAGGRYRGAVFMYTIQPGETLAVLAHRFGTTVRVLRELNAITAADQVKVGSTIAIPQR
ncbi:MAG: LysM peptidoglycan-binding domain-containing protein [Oscillospiraceae bacterium]|nr:LysM peptidoglycan-binding domain-containing protein [Oscillospiraceae bacterium]